MVALARMLSESQLDRVVIEPGVLIEFGIVIRMLRLMQ